MLEPAIRPYFFKGRALLDVPAHPAVKFRFSSKEVKMHASPQAILSRCQAELEIHLVMTV